MSTDDRSPSTLVRWTLLDEHCPQTGAVPLLEDTTGRKWSAAIDGYVDAGNEEKRNETSPDDVDEKRTLPSREGEGDGEPSSPFDSNSYAPGDRIHRIELNKETSEKSASKSPSSSLSVVKDVPDSGTTLRREIASLAIDALMSKIDAARRLLQTTRDVEQSRSLAALIGECGSAVSALKNIRE